MMNTLFKGKFKLYFHIFLLVTSIALFSIVAYKTYTSLNVEASTIKKTILEGSETKNKVCVLDSFEYDEKTDKGLNASNSYISKYSHGQKVTHVIQDMHPDIEIQTFEVEDVTFESDTSELLLDCDIINYSMSVSNRSEWYLDKLVKFMKKYDGYIVAAAGNPREIDEYGTITQTTNLSQWSYLKRQYKGQDWTQRIFIVTQGVENYADNINITMSRGKEVDYVVNQFGTKDQLEGSSFAAPYFTGLLFGKLEYGDKIEYEIQYDDQYHEGYYKYITGGKY